MRDRSKDRSRSPYRETLTAACQQAAHKMREFRQCISLNKAGSLGRFFDPERKPNGGDVFVLLSDL